MFERAAGPTTRVSFLSRITIALTVRTNWPTCIGVFFRQFGRSVKALADRSLLMKCTSRRKGEQIVPRERSSRKSNISLSITRAARARSFYSAERSNWRRFVTTFRDGPPVWARELANESLNDRSIARAAGPRMAKVKAPERH